MNIPSPLFVKHPSGIHSCYAFFGTVDRMWNRNEWMFAKVGIANNVQRRLTNYRTNCPVPFSAGFRIQLPSIERARSFEKAILTDEDLIGFSSQGEWFVIQAGPKQHVLFIKDLLARLYIERYWDKSLWDASIEWVILPDQEQITEIPGASLQYLAGPETGEEIADKGEPKFQELALRVRAEYQANALGGLIYPELKEERFYRPE